MASGCLYGELMMGVGSHLANAEILPKWKDVSEFKSMKEVFYE